MVCVSVTVHLRIRPPCLANWPDVQTWSPHPCIVRRVPRTTTVQREKTKEKKKKQLANPRYIGSSEITVHSAVQWLCSWLILMTWCGGCWKTATCNRLCLRCGGPVRFQPGRDRPPFVSSPWSVPPPAVVVGYDFFFWRCRAVAR